MPSSEQLESLLCEAASLLGVRTLTAYQARAAWRLVRDAVGFDIEHDAQHERIVISAPIGAVPDSQRLRIYEMLLQYNYLWTETGGLRMALDGEPRHAVLLLEMGLAMVSPQAVCRVIENMAQVHRGWVELLGLLGDAPAADGAPQAVDAGMPVTFA